jgi:hypothetical protein
MGSDTDAGYNATHLFGPNDDGAARAFKAALLAMSDVGEDEDFARRDDAQRVVDLNPAA